MDVLSQRMPCNSWELPLNTFSLSDTANQDTILNFDCVVLCLHGHLTHLGQALSQLILIDELATFSNLRKSGCCFQIILECISIVTSFTKATLLAMLARTTLAHYSFLHLRVPVAHFDT